jgi:hypothetical protein
MELAHCDHGVPDHHSCQECLKEAQEKGSAWDEK